ncbi:hypothetical protein [Comamonas sp. MYb69]|uniref:hypothetical protein n=1 Tax=Comamonas sp. MYb69 TaxID=1848650 RepID=UPI0030A2DC34
MHTLEFKNRISIFLDESEQFKAFIDGLHTLSSYANAMDQFLKLIPKGSAQYSNSGTGLHSHLANTKSVIAGINNRQFFRSLEGFQKSLLAFEPENKDPTSLISTVERSIENFSDVYDHFLSHQNPDNALPLILAARELNTQISVLYKAFSFFEDKLIEQAVPGSSESKLTVILPQHLTLKDFAKKLLAIQELYSELCMLMAVSEASEPLRIAKIESGSLWAMVIGETRIINLMTSFLERTATWAYRNYTSEGKITAIPQKVEAIDSLLGLSKRLAEQNIDTTIIKEHISKSAVALSKNLSEILDGQPSITINDQTISVGTESHKNFISNHSTLHLSRDTPLGEKESNESPPMH